MTLIILLNKTVSKTLTGDINQLKTYLIKIVILDRNTVIIAISSNTLCKIE